MKETICVIFGCRSTSRCVELLYCYQHLHLGDMPIIYHDVVDDLFTTVNITEGSDALV